MKRIVVVALVAALLTLVFSVGCELVEMTGSGDLETKEFDFSDFTRVEVGSAFEVKVDQSDSYSVSVTADDNLFDRIEVSKQGSTLKIDVKRATLLRATLEAEITMPELRGVDLSGATHGTMSGFSSTENLDIELSGASSLDMVEMSAGDVKLRISGASRASGDVAAGDVEFDLSGASTVELQGSAGDIVVDGSGASRVKLGGFSVNNADVNLSGASTGTVNLDGTLDADLSGASKLSYIGQPTMGTINTSGASTIGKE